MTGLDHAMRSLPKLGTCSASHCRPTRLSLWSRNLAPLSSPQPRVSNLQDRRWPLLELLGTPAE